MGETTIDGFLRTFGLTDTEIEVYVFLSKHGVLKCTELSRAIEKDRAQSQRILKSLQKKGLVETTLESPIRYSSVPFEHLIEQSIKAKKNEAALIEETKKELLTHWNKIGTTDAATSPERFMVIEGAARIYSKIVQMVTDTKRQLSTVSTVGDLLRGAQFGLFNAILKHPSKSAVDFRFLTEVSNDNLATVKSIIRGPLKKRVNLKGRNPELGLRLFPRMVIMDNEEIVFFIKQKTAEEKQSDLCLWTNCADLVQAFTVVFEELWEGSSELQTNTDEVKASAQTATTEVINDTDECRQMYEEQMLVAKKEVIMIAPPNGPIEFCKNKQLLEKWDRKKVSVKVMVSITSENIEAVRQLCKHCEVRHIPAGYLPTTIIDGSSLLQFKNYFSGQQQPSKSDFANTFYTNDNSQVAKTRNTLNDIWENALTPSIVLASNTSPPMSISPFPEKLDPLLRHNSAYQKMVVNVAGKPEQVTEKNILEKIASARRVSGKNWPKSLLRFYGSSGQAVIHPPDKFHLPNILFRAIHENKRSSFGATNRLYVYLWLEAAKGFAYVPVASVTDNPRDTDFQKTLLLKTPAENNIQYFQKDEIQLRFNGRTFFAGWTKPIPLIPSKYTLPPACIMLERCTKIEAGVTEFTYPSGVKVNVQVNGYGAFVTFFHPASKYSGPGTDGVIGRDLFVTIYPP